jgi:hypothetical protein
MERDALIFFCDLVKYAFSGLTDFWDKVLEIFTWRALESYGSFSSPVSRRLPDLYSVEIEFRALQATSRAGAMPIFQNHNECPGKKPGMHAKPRSSSLSGHYEHRKPFNLVIYSEG